MTPKQHDKLSSIAYLNQLKEQEQKQTEVINDKSSLMKMFESFLDNHFGSVKDKTIEQGETQEFLNKLSNQNSPSEVNLFKTVNHEEQITLEVVYEPYKPDAHGEWMSPETILKACANFNDNLTKGVVKPNLFHLQDATNQIKILKTYIIEEEMNFGDKDAPVNVPAGTWVAEIKYLDKTLWELRKAGVVGGLSIGAKGIVLDPVGKQSGDE